MGGPMRTSFSRAVLRGTLAGALSTLLICGAIGQASAEDDDELPDVKVMRSIMKGLGLKKPGEENQIEYRERSPLVIPPSLDLPAPETTSIVDKNPAWPDDPDLKARREAKKHQRRSVDWEEDSRALTPRELDRPGASRTVATNRTGAEQKSGEEAVNQISPSALGYKGGLWKLKSFMGFEPEEETATFEHEPKRTDLTQPPPGYMTPSTEQPYGVGKEVVKNKATNIYDRAAGDPR